MTCSFPYVSRKVQKWFKSSVTYLVRFLLLGTPATRAGTTIALHSAQDLTSVRSSGLGHPTLVTLPCSIARRHSSHMSAKAC